MRKTTLACFTPYKVGLSAFDWVALKLAALGPAD